MLISETTSMIGSGSSCVCSSSDFKQRSSFAAQLWNMHSNHNTWPDILPVDVLCQSMYRLSQETLTFSDYEWSTIFKSILPMDTITFSTWTQFITSFGKMPLFFKQMLSLQFRYYPSSRIHTSRSGSISTSSSSSSSCSVESVDAKSCPIYSRLENKTFPFFFYVPMTHIPSSSIAFVFNMTQDNGSKIRIPLHMDYKQSRYYWNNKQETYETPLEAILHLSDTMIRSCSEFKNAFVWMNQFNELLNKIWNQHLKRNPNAPVVNTTVAPIQMILKTEQKDLQKDKDKPKQQLQHIQHIEHVQPIQQTEEKKELSYTNAERREGIILSCFKMIVLTLFILFICYHVVPFSSLLNQTW
jgi:hypothetical protein